MVDGSWITCAQCGNSAWPHVSHPNICRKCVRENDKAARAIGAVAGPPPKRQAPRTDYRRGADLAPVVCRSCNRKRIPYRAMPGNLLPAICRSCVTDIGDQNALALSRSSDPNTCQRRCYYCLEFKNGSDFHKVKSDSSRRWTPLCGVCTRLTKRITDSERRGPVNEFIQAQKRGKVCTDCKNTWPYFILEFDHRDPDTKKFTIGNMVNSHWKESDWGEILEEIAKCDLVCKNCHAIRSRRNGHLGPPSLDLSASELRDQRAKYIEPIRLRPLRGKTKEVMTLEQLALNFG